MRRHCGIGRIVNKENLKTVKPKTIIELTKVSEAPVAEVDGGCCCPEMESSLAELFLAFPPSFFVEGSSPFFLSFPAEAKCKARTTTSKKGKQNFKAEENPQNKAKNKVHTDKNQTA